MDVKVTVGGVEAVVSVTSATEAAELLRAISLQGEGAGDTGGTTQQAGAGSRESLPKEMDRERVKTALMDIKGNPSAKLVAAIAQDREGCNDEVLRQRAGLEVDANFGPLMAHISKCCKRVGLERDALFESQSKRARRGGKVRYFFRITSVADALLREIPKFEDEKADGFDMPSFDT